MNWRERIIIDPAVLAGKPIIQGTRLAVEFIIDLLAHEKKLSYTVFLISFTVPVF